MKQEYTKFLNDIHLKSWKINKYQNDETITSSKNLILIIDFPLLNIITIDLNVNNIKVSDLIDIIYQNIKDYYDTNESWIEFNDLILHAIYINENILTLGIF